MGKKAIVTETGARDKGRDDGPGKGFFEATMQKGLARQAFVACKTHQNLCRSPKLNMVCVAVPL